MATPNINLNGGSASPLSRWQTAGTKQYELSNHLGNVLTTVNDIRNQDTNLLYQSTVTGAQDYYAFGMVQPGRAFSSNNYRYGFNGQEKSDEVRGEGNQIDFGERIYDSRIGRFLSMDPLANAYPFQSPYNFAANSPITLVDVMGMGPGDPLKHTVAKGDNLTKISRKYGVSKDDLAKMNGIRDVNKISVGQELLVNPEADFSKNPRGAYQNTENSFGSEVTIGDIAYVGMDFVLGQGEENSIIVGGGALESVQNWDVVKGLMKSGLEEITSDDKWAPGDVAYRYMC